MALPDTPIPIAFQGFRFRLYSAPLVVVDGEPLDPAPSLRVRQHSPAEFDFGHPGPGAAQLALALLLKVGTDPAIAVSLYQRFKAKAVARFPSTWRMQASDVLAWVKRQR